MPLKIAWSTGLTDVRTTDVEGVGRLRTEDDGKMYRWVKNAETTVTLAAGAVAYHSFSDTTTSVQNVKQALTANLGYMGGIVMASLAALSYGWVQCVGLNSIALVFASQTTAKTAGDFLKGTNAQQYGDADTTMGTAPTHRRNLQLLEAVATVTPGASAAKNVYVNCL